MDAIIRLFEYKTKVINEILLNPDIIKALVDTTPQFKDNTDPKLNDQEFRDKLLYSQVYPYMPVTSTFNEAKSYITVSLGLFDSKGSYIVDGNIKIYILCHNSLIRTDSGQRHGFIANQIDNMINLTSGFGIGKLGNKRMEEIVVNTDYLGVYLQYSITDFSI